MICFQSFQPFKGWKLSEREKFVSAFNKYSPYGTLSYGVYFMDYPNLVPNGTNDTFLLFLIDLSRRDTI